MNNVNNEDYKMTDKEHLILDVQAELVGAASIFAHEDKDLMPLACVYVFPGFKGGAVIYALNGHIAFFAEDETGVVDEPVRITFSSDFVKTCGCKVDSESLSRVQISKGGDYVRVFSQVRGGKVWTDFAPSYFTLNPQHYPAYGRFVGKFSEAHSGISAQIINGNSLAKIQKIFKQKENFHPVLHQNPKNTESPIFITFEVAPHVLIVNMPMSINCEGIEDIDDAPTYYGNLSDIAQSLCAAPCANGVE